MAPKSDRQVCNDAKGTLHWRVNLKRPVQKQGPKPLLSLDEELVLIDYITALAQRGFPRSRILIQNPLRFLHFTSFSDATRKN